MTVTIVCVGKLKEGYWRDAAAEYCKRLSAYCTVRIIETADEKIPENPSLAIMEQIRQKETARVWEKIPRRDFVVALELSGTALDSVAFAEFLSERALHGVSGFTFVIGGSLGLSPAIAERADYRLCMSRMTFPHQLARVILLEQLYRAFRISRGETYHK